MLITEDALMNMDATLTENGYVLEAGSVRMTFSRSPLYNKLWNVELESTLYNDQKGPQAREQLILADFKEIIESAFDLGKQLGSKEAKQAIRTVLEID
jgi:hypothetical protein